MDGHTQHDDIGVGNYVGCIGALLLDLSVVGLEDLAVHVLDFANYGVIPIARAAGHEVDIVIRLSKEWNENVGGVSAASVRESMGGW